MVNKTFTFAAGGSWETSSNWTSAGVPGSNDDAFLTNAVTGTYAVTMSAAEGPNSVTINDPTATLSVSGTGSILSSPIALNSGTFALAGQVLGSTISAAGGVFAGDKIDLPGLATTTLGTYSGNASGGMLPVLNNGTAFAILTLVGNYVGANFSINTDGQTGNQITVACYAAGTRILTAAGEVAVEALREGDEVVALAGAERRNETDQVDRAIAKSPSIAIATPSPWRRSASVRGRSRRGCHIAIFWCRPTTPSCRATCWCRHVAWSMALLSSARNRPGPFATSTSNWHGTTSCSPRGMPAESYLDTGNRTAFSMRVGRKCSPLARCGRGGTRKPGSRKRMRRLVLAGPMVDAAHAALLNRAVAMGYARTDDAGLSAEADGAMVSVTASASGHWSVRVPAGTRELRLRSRPAVLDDRSLADGRRTGIPVAAMRLNGAELGLDHPALAGGFHPLERRDGAHWRWTDGNALLSLPPFCAEAVLEITGFTGWRGYWVAAQTPPP